MRPSLPELADVTRWWSNQPLVDGYWGPTTSSIDWCEANYTITRFVAEFTNTFSNASFACGALYGIKKCRDEKLPFPLALCQAGIGLVGMGSFMFHATLQYEWQLADELPMIFTAAFGNYLLFDTGKASAPRTRFVSCLPFLLALYAFGFTAIYLRYPNPVFLQVAFGFMQIVNTSRQAYLLLTAPVGTYREKKNKADAAHYQILSFLASIIGFLMWNIDNVFCDRLSQLKEYMGVPWSFVLEAHAWWHIAMCIGAYLGTIASQLMTLSLKEGTGSFEIKYGGVFGLCPYVARIPTEKQSKLE